MCFERLNGRAYPTHKGDGLRVGNDTMGWFFIFDDQFDGPLGSDPAAVGGITDAMARPLGEDNEAAADRGDAPTRAFRALWRRSRTGMSAAWRARARENWIRYLRSYRWEAESRLRGGCPDLGAYPENRRDATWSLEPARYTAAGADRAGSAGPWRALLVASPPR